MGPSRKIWDISQRLSPALPVWPGDTSFNVCERWTFGAGSPVNVAAIGLSTHCGAHADAPRHYDPAGLAIDQVALEPYLGPARVVDARGQEEAVSASFVQTHWSPGVERMLFRTFDRFPLDHWPARFTVMSADAIRMLAALDVMLIGIDSPSLDPETSKTMDAHLAVPPGMRILEGLVLDHVPPGDYELIALPLALAGLDASPVRAVLRELGN
ncbi:MAG TPA: arylformamidase [Rhizomicrobium sp.]|nr:arylformamidase [Rhizomicrobium sp.]